jgi:hypothetical protein
LSHPGDRLTVAAVECESDPHFLAVVAADLEPVRAPAGIGPLDRDAAVMPGWIPPQLTQLVDAAPEGDEWLHEIKFDGYRMHARLDRGTVKLLTRTGLDWTHKYPPIAAAVVSLGARQAYLDGELCCTFPNGVTSFSMIQAASDAGNASGLVYFIFDLLHRDGVDVGGLPLIERKAQLAQLLSDVAPPLHYSDYHRGGGPAFHQQISALPKSRTASASRRRRCIDICPPRGPRIPKASENGRFIPKKGRPGRFQPGGGRFAVRRLRILTEVRCRGQVPTNSGC